MFDEWKKRRKLQRRISDTIKELQTWRGVSDDYETDEAALSKLRHRLNRERQQLDIFESNILLNKARRLVIKLPITSSWWLDDNEFGHIMSPDEITKWLSGEGKLGVAKLIKEEKRKNIEWWVKTIIVPLLTVIVSVLSLLVALVTVSKK